MKRNYFPINNDEIILNVDEYVAVPKNVFGEEGDNLEWVHGTNLSSGNSGNMPYKYLRRVPESNTWSLHTAVQFIGPGLLTRNQVEDFPEMPEDGVSLEEIAREFIESEKKTMFWLSSIGKQLQKPNTNKKLIVMRHAERMDYNFRNWSRACITTLNTEPPVRQYTPLDLNMPKTLPEREYGINPDPWKTDTPITNIGT